MSADKKTVATYPGYWIMKMHLATITLISLCGLIQPVSAVIVAGASGGGDTFNNTTANQYFAETGVSFQAYNNVIQYSDASGVYLGYNAGTHDVWVLTARHISTDGSAGATVTIDGLTYNRQADGGDGYGILVGGDLRLVRYHRGDNQVPGLTALSLSTTVPTASTSLVMAGFGRNRVENAAANATTNDSTSTTVGTGYHWAGGQIERWGTNNIGDLGAGVTLTVVDLGLGYTTTTFVTNFDTPGSGEWLSSNEAQGSAGDSGGGVFIYDNGQWVLSGIMSAVDGPVGQDASSSAFGNSTYATDINTYSSAINSAIGATLIPEPATWWLATCGLILALRRRR
jgi:hypothetical protein